MVLGLYYITKIRPGAKGEGLTFYGPEEAIIAHNEGRCDLHAKIKCVVDDLVGDNPVRHMVETSVGRVIVNQIIPDEVGYFNDIIQEDLTWHYFRCNQGCRNGSCLLVP